MPNTNLKKLSIAATDVEGTLNDLPSSIEFEEFNCDPLIYPARGEVGHTRKVGELFDL